MTHTERWGLLMRDTPVGPEIAVIGGVPAEHMQIAAEVAAQHGWQILWECNAEPDLAEAAETIQAGDGLAKLPWTERLRALTELHTPPSR